MVCVLEKFAHDEAFLFNCRRQRRTRVADNLMIHVFDRHALEIGRHVVFFLLFSFFVQFVICFEMIVSKKFFTTFLPWIVGIELVG